MTYQERILAAADYLRPYAQDCVCALTLGSGLSGFTERASGAAVISYSDIPGFPVSTVPGHAGKMIIGTVAGKKIMIMNGRYADDNTYETERAQSDIIYVVSAVRPD